MDRWRSTSIRKTPSVTSPTFIFFAADPEGPGICATILTLVSFVLVLVTLPLSLCVTVKVNIFVFKAHLLAESQPVSGESNPPLPSCKPQPQPRSWDVNTSFTAQVATVAYADVHCPQPRLGLGKKPGLSTRPGLEGPTRRLGLSSKFRRCRQESTRRPTTE